MSPLAKAQSTTFNWQAPPGIATTAIRRWVNCDRRRLGLTGLISIVTVTPAVSRQLNTRYRRKRRPTNILTFVDHERQTKKGGASGEIILCPGVIRQEARKQQQPYRPYFHFILQHGLIHLLGLDHQTRAEQSNWDIIECRLTYVKN